MLGPGFGWHCKECKMSARRFVLLIEPTVTTCSLLQEIQKVENGLLKQHIKILKYRCVTP